MWIAITRDVSASLAGCELSFVPRVPIDVTRARQQHAAYVHALESLGCRVLQLPAQDAMPDAVFVEDVAVVFDEVAVMTRPGAASRRDEGASVAPLLASLRPLRTLHAPGTLDGGDVMRVGRDVYVGRSARSNDDGIEQLRSAVSPFGYRVHAVVTHACLHLKSAVTPVVDGTLLVQPAWVDVAQFEGYRLIEVDPAEEHAANALRVGDAPDSRVISPACFPGTHRRLREAGIAVTAVDVSELQKAEGATTCCSLVLRDLAHPHGA